ncbi:MAG TPA: alkaline phosphatase family protein [Acidothermaceae bacterium]|nr:alkaline phosphatase family protein [Acidothermaceae bacterium]
MRRRRITRPSAILPIVLALLVVSAVGGWTLGAHWRPPAGALCQTSSAGAPHPTKLMVIIGENEGQADVNNTTAPFEQTVLSKQCGSLRDMHALTHGSEPNYIGMTSGSYPSWALCDQPPNTTDSDCAQSPSSLISGPSVFSQLAAAYGATGWRTYAESMPARCSVVDGTKYKASTGQIRYKYVARHNPAVYYRDLPSCAADDVALGNSQTMKGAFYSDAQAGRLPKVTFVIPDNIDNGHDTLLTTYDGFLSRTLRFLQTTPDYRSGALEIIVTFDEGSVAPGSHASTGEDCLNPEPVSSAPSCLMAAWVVGRYVPNISDTRFESHYSVLKTIELWAGLPLLGHAADANTNAIDSRLIPTTGRA